MSAWDWIDDHTYTPDELIMDAIGFGADAYHGATEVAGAAVDGAQATYGATKVVASAADAAAGFVPGGWFGVGVVALIALAYFTFRAMFPAVKVAAVEASAAFAETKAPGAGEHVRTVAGAKANSRSERTARDAVRTRATNSTWGSGTQSHVAVDGKCPIIERVDDRQGRPRRLVVCAPSQADANQRMKKSFVAGFRCPSEPQPCDDHDHRYHYMFVPAQQVHQAPARRKAPRNPR